MTTNNKAVTGEGNAPRKKVIGKPEAPAEIDKHFASLLQEDGFNRAIIASPRLADYIRDLRLRLFSETKRADDAIIKNVEYLNEIARLKGEMEHLAQSFDGEHAGRLKELTALDGLLAAAKQAVVDGQFHDDTREMLASAIAAAESASGAVSS